jgi:anti-sigma factor RsiW
MNCTQAHDQLPALLYGELRSEEKAYLEKHLAECSTCRQEYAALREVRELLDRVPAPEYRLDLPKLYRQAADRQVRRVRIWRRMAVACCGAAAALAFIALVWRMEARLEPHQLVLRWGPVPVGGQAIQSPAPTLAQAAKAAPPETEEQLRLLSQLIHALADTAEARDFRQRQELVQLRAELGELQRRTAQWRRDTERDVGALYTAHLISVRKGEKP